jgi:PAS domain S-box-containing protein
MEVPGEPWIADLTPILDTALDAVVVMTEDGVVAGWNAIAESTFGWSRDEAIGRQLSELIIPPRYREAHHRGLAHYVATGEGPLLNRRVEIVGLRSTGDEFPIELSITSTDLAGERLFLGFLRDISSRKAAETALRESEARLAATYNHALVGIAEIDRSGRFLRANGQYSVMTGYSLDELREMTFLDITHPADVEKDRALFERQWSGATKGYTLEKRYVRKDGDIIWVEVAASLVRGDESSEAFGVRILRDITDKKRAEEQQRLLLNELNHRVKNTLTVVQGLAHQTFKGGAVPPELLRSFEGRLGALAAARQAGRGSRRGQAGAVRGIRCAGHGRYGQADRRLSRRAVVQPRRHHLPATLPRRLRPNGADAAGQGLQGRPAADVHRQHLPSGPPDPGADQLEQLPALRPQHEYGGPEFGNGEGPGGSQQHLPLGSVPLADQLIDGVTILPLQGTTRESGAEIVQTRPVDAKSIVTAAPRSRATAR